MKKYSFFIISLFLSSTVSYGQEIQEPDAFYLEIAQSNNPIGYLRNKIRDQSNLLEYLINLFKDKPLIIQGFVVENKCIKNCQETLEDLYAQVARLEKELEETTIEVYELAGRVEK